MRYAIFIENYGTRFRASVPDLPDCVAEGDTAAEAKKLVREMIETDLRGILEDGMPLPQASSRAEYVEV